MQTLKAWSASPSTDAHLSGFVKMTLADGAGTANSDHGRALHHTRVPASTRKHDRYFVTLLIGIFSVQTRSANHYPQGFHASNFLQFLLPPLLFHAQAPFGIYFSTPSCFS